jgi:GT2 family glycosyltransferase
VLGKVKPVKLDNCSIVVPLGVKEREHEALIQSLIPLLGTSEIIVVAPDVARQRQLLRYGDKKVKLVKSEIGRARQMNAAAREARYEYLWFLHADSRLSAGFGFEKDTDTIIKVKEIIERQAGGLFYFDLHFRVPAYSRLHLNESLVYCRCRLLSLPFGDQGFLLSGKDFHRFGGFDEDKTFGEDMDFVLRLRKDGYPVLPIGKRLYTSARKYQKEGWLKTTLNHAYLGTRLYLESKIPLPKRRCDKAQGTAHLNLEAPDGDH